MKFTLATRPQPDWDSLARVIDPHILDKGEQTIKAYVSSMNELLGENQVKQHLYYSFYFELDDDFVIAIAAVTNLRLAIKHPDRKMLVGIMSGNVQSLEDACKTFSSPETPVDLRRLFNAMMTFLEVEGFRFPYSKHELKDRTFQIK